MSDPGSRTFTTAPTEDEIAVLADAALAILPVVLLRHVHNLVIRVQDFPDDETVAAMALESPFDLLGLYHGVDLTRRSVNDPPPGPDVIFLYRRPILDEWCDGDEDLPGLVRHVLVHEIGHHFGLSDEDMERIEAETP